MDSYEELLIQAIKDNDFKCLQYCLLKGANPNKICSCGRTPLGIAAQNGNFSILRTLAENQKNTLTYKSNNDSDQQRKPLNLDFTVNKSKNRNIGYFVVCKDMEENEFGEGPTPDGMEALEWDMEVTEDNSEEDCLSSTPPEARIYKWYADVLNRTAIVLESPENDIARFDRYGLNALHYAVIHGHCDIVEYLIDNFKEISVNQSDADLFSPLQIAVHNGDLRMVKLLIEKGANVQFMNRQRHTPLHLAAQKGYVDVIVILIENGANLNAHDVEDCTPLSLAILFAHEDAAKILIRKGTRLNHEEACGYTVLHRAVWNNMTGIAKALLEAGAKIIQSHFLSHIAIRNNNFEMIKLLHKAGAVLNIRDEQGQTPLMLSCIYSNLQIAKYLLKNDYLLIMGPPRRRTQYNSTWEKDFSWITSYPTDKYSAYCKLCKRNFKVDSSGHAQVKSHAKSKMHSQRETLSLNTSSQSTFRVDSAGTICLRRGNFITKLKFYGHSNVYSVNYSFACCTGAPSNARNELTGLTALHICVDSIRDPKMFQQFLELLLSYEADINASSFMGNILFYAIIVGNLKAACTLVKYGADVNLREERGFVDNLTLAKKNGNTELVKLIVYSGFNFSNMLFDIKCLKTQNDDPLFDFMAYVSSKPLSLRDICRIRIRFILGRNLIKKIYQLPLPTMLMHFLALEEL